MAGAAILLLTTSMSAQIKVSKEDQKKYEKDNYNKDKRVTYGEIREIHDKFVAIDQDSRLVLLLQMASQESMFYPKSISSTGATGFIQILSSTHLEIQHRIVHTPIHMIDDHKLFDPFYSLLNAQIYLNWFAKHGPKRKRFRDIVKKKGLEFAVLMAYKEGLSGMCSDWNSLKYRRGWKYAVDVQNKHEEALQILNKALLTQHTYDNQKVAVK